MPPKDIGAALIGQAISRRISAGKKVLLADIRQENADVAAKVLSDAGFDIIASSAAKRAGTPDEIGSAAALLMGPDGTFITGSDLLIDGGVTATYWFGDVSEVR